MTFLERLKSRSKLNLTRLFALQGMKLLSGPTRRRSIPPPPLGLLTLALLLTVVDSATVGPTAADCSAECTCGVDSITCIPCTAPPPPKAICPVSQACYKPDILAPGGKITGKCTQATYTSGKVDPIATCPPDTVAGGEGFTGCPGDASGPCVCCIPRTLRKSLQSPSYLIECTYL